MVGRSVQVNSLCFTKADWKQNLANGAKANLLVFPPGVKKNGNEGTKAYIENGEQQGFNKGYKTSIRDDLIKTTYERRTEICDSWLE